MTNKPFSQACENNREPILRVLKPVFAKAHSILEIGSGTGQHAVYFAAQLPHLLWNTSDQQEHHVGIQAWLQDSQLPNVKAPIALEVTRDWPDAKFDGVFSANTAHIMSWSQVESFFAGVAKVLVNDGRFLLYGPFNYAGAYTSDSNAQFDVWLKQRDPLSGIRDLEALVELADRTQMKLEKDYEMPANNRLLCWVKQ